MFFFAYHRSSYRINLKEVCAKPPDGLSVEEKKFLRFEMLEE